MVIKNNIPVAMVATGFAGIAAQVIMLRELMVSYQGSEMSLGIILGNWLMLEALGCLIAGKFSGTLKNPILVFCVAQISLPIGLPFGLFIARSAGAVMGLPVGQGLGIDAMFLTSMLALLPVSLMHGTSFVLGSAVLGGGASGLGRSYIYETLGTLVGGAVVTFALIPIMHSFHIALVVMAVSLVGVFAVLWDGGRIKKDKCYITYMGLCAIICVAVLGLSINWTAAWHDSTISRQWAGQRVVNYENSIYGNITVIERGGEYTFFLDGQPAITTPTPDIIRTEEFVHFAMLSHPRPEQVLVMTGGAGGMLNEILKYPSLKKVDYVELDPMLLEKVKEFSTPLTYSEMNDPRTRLHFADGRFFLKGTQSSYDLCFIGVANPTDLRTNRFFTREFFEKVKGRLNPGGIMAISLPSLPRAQIHIPGLAAMNRTVYATIRDVFMYVRVIPGDSFNIFLASNTEHIFEANASSMMAGMTKAGIEVQLLTEPYIAYRMLPWWLDNFYASIYKPDTGGLNLDFEPRAVYQSMQYFSAKFTPRIADMLEYLKLHGLLWFVMGIGIIMLAGLSMKRKGDIPISIATTGFAGMMLDLVLIFAFQSIFGYAFHWIGILVSAFMAGAAVGGLAMTRMLPFIKHQAKAFMRTEMTLVIFSLVLPGILILLHLYTYNPLPVIITQISFILLSFVCGLSVGLQYPLACQIVMAQGVKQGKTAGLLYGQDLIGGWVGGIIGGLFLLPVVGLVNACLIMAGIKICSMALVFAARGERYV